MSQLCKKIRVIGRVQGVFFRAFAQKQANHLQLRGWTCNEDDGSVLVVACGEAQPLDELIEALRIGPLAARVDEVQVMAMEYTDFDGFVIKRETKS